MFWILFLMAQVFATLQLPNMGVLYKGFAIVGCEITQALNELHRQTTSKPSLRNQTNLTP